MSRSNKKDYPKKFDSRRFDYSCRCHGSCSYCRRNRLHFDSKARSKADLTEQSNEWFGYWFYPDPIDIDMTLTDELGEKFGIVWRDW
jgi:hypothetical protein